MSALHSFFEHECASFVFSHNDNDDDACDITRPRNIGLEFGAVEHEYASFVLFFLLIVFCHYRHIDIISKRSSFITGFS